MQLISEIIDKNPVTIIKDAFEKKYQEVTSEQYYWTAKDAKHATQIVTKLKHRAKNKGYDLTGNKIQTAINWMVDNAPDWIRGQLELSLLNSKFNVICNQKKKVEQDTRPLAERMGWV